MTTKVSENETTVGNYFVSNYPPYSFWKAEHVGEVIQVLESDPKPETPLGIYLHIPFCRKRCHFCYFKVYTDKNSSEIKKYLDALICEMSIYAKKPFFMGRKPRFIYFGGGTPSYLSSEQLFTLAHHLKLLFPYDAAKEVTFEGEPGTLTEQKLKTIKEIGVTRLSLGIENFDDHVLEINGRAHHSKEVFRAYEQARKLNFQQINIDLIAGMMGETDENWGECIKKTIDLQPDSVTIYQMEVPYNTTIYHEMKEQGKTVAPTAGWETKRQWVDDAFTELEKAGYTLSSAYTAIKDSKKTHFIYRDDLWTGADLIGLGVASFSHLKGVHFQNDHDLSTYFSKIEHGELPLYRALRISLEERLIRELILQLKLGHIHPLYFKDKFNVNIAEHFKDVFARLQSQGFLHVTNRKIVLNRRGLLQIDCLLKEFFLPEHQTHHALRRSF